MRFYRDRIYPLLVDRLGNPPPIDRIRREILPLARGTVLEIGLGAGANLRHYNSGTIDRLFALEPNRGMVRLARQQARRTTLTIEFLDLLDGRVPLEPASVDTVVSTFTLCTIADVADSIRGLRRILRPDGNLVFFELGVSPDPAVRRWQRRLEPAFHWLFEGLRLTRDIPSLLVQNGFRIERIDAAYLARFPKAASYCWWGSARPTTLAGANLPA